MIQYENNSVKIEGSRIDLITELICIMRFFLERGVVDKARLIEYALVSCMSKEELKQSIVDAIDGMEDIGDALSLLGMLEGGLH